MPDFKDKNEEYVEARIFFRLEVDDGWPLVSVESMWAERREDGLFRLDNIPLFAEDANLNDIVRAEVGDDGVLEFREFVESGGYITVRICTEPELTRSILDVLSRHGAEYEQSPFEDIGYFSASIPPEADWEAVESYLNELEEDGATGWGATF